MKLYKVVMIDLDKERQRIDRPNIYSISERTKLHNLYNLFEAGKFKQAIQYSKKWEKYEREYINEEVWNVLWEMCIGEQYILEPKPSVKEPL